MAATDALNSSSLVNAAQADSAALCDMQSLCDMQWLLPTQSISAFAHTSLGLTLRATNAWQPHTILKTTA
jgi:hypothetical protein